MELYSQVAVNGAAESRSSKFCSLAPAPRHSATTSNNANEPIWQFLSFDAVGCSTGNYPKNALVYAQGEPSNAIFFVVEGWVKISAVSAQGRQAVLSIMGAGDILGDTCVFDQPFRTSSATTVECSSLLRIEKQDLRHILRRDPRFAEGFLRRLLSQKERLEQGLVNQLFNSSEKRLASILLSLASDGSGRIPRINQETLAAMVGTTRSRISFFMNKLKRFGLIRYDDGIRIDQRALGAFLDQD